MYVFHFLKSGCSAVIAESPKIRFRDLSTKRSKNTRRAGPQRLDCCAKPSGHAPSPSFWGWVRHAHSVRMTVPGPNFISHMPGTDPSMVRLQVYYAHSSNASQEVYSS